MNTPQWGGARGLLAISVVGALSGLVGIAPALAQSPGASDGSSLLAGKRFATVAQHFDGYQQAVGNWFIEEARARGADARALDGKGDANEQSRIISDLVAEKVDGIAFAPVDPRVAGTSIQEAQAAGIPVVLLGLRPDPSTGVVAPTALAEDREGATLAGQHAGEWLKANRPGEPAKVVIFDILTAPTCKEQRMDGFLAGLTSVMGEENVELKFRDTVEHRRDVAQAKMEDLLQRDPDFNVFTACGGDGALGGIAALQGAGRAKAIDKVPQTEYIFTIDGTPSELQLLFDPSSSVMETYTLTPKHTGQLGIEMLQKIISGEIGITEDIVFPLPGLLLPPDCEATKLIFEEQYGLNSDYEALDCSVFGPTAS